MLKVAPRRMALRLYSAATATASRRSPLFRSMIVPTLLRLSLDTDDGKDHDGSLLCERSEVL